MKVFHKFICLDLLEKAKKSELVSFSKNVLGQKIPSNAKKEVYLEAIKEKLTDKSVGIEKYIEHFNWDLKPEDIVQEIDYEDIYNAFTVIQTQLNYLFYKLKNLDTSREEKIASKKERSYLFRIKENTLDNLLRLKKVKVLEYVTIFHEETLKIPNYYDIDTNKKLDDKKYILLPNMKYCKQPKNNKPLDLNNIKYLGSYRVETIETVSNNFYTIDVNGIKYASSSKAIPKIINTQKIPKVVKDNLPRNVITEPVDYVTLHKNIDILKKVEELVKENNKNNNRNNK